MVVVVLASISRPTCLDTFVVMVMKLTLTPVFTRTVVVYMSAVKQQKCSLFRTRHTRSAPASYLIS